MIGREGSYPLIVSYNNNGELDFSINNQPNLNGYLFANRRENTFIVN